MDAHLLLLDSDDSRWDEVVDRTSHDVYHLRGYARACETHESYPVQLAVVDDGRDALVAPVIIRPLPEALPGSAGLTDVTAPYGYPSPVCTSADPAVQAELLKTLLGGLSEHGCVSAFVRCNPFVGVDGAVLRDEAEVVTHGELVVVDVTALPDTVPAAFRADHRRAIRLLRDAGFSARIDDPEHIKAFPQLYRDRMVAVDANPYYLFPDAYFDTLFGELDDHARLVSVVDAHGTLAAAAIVLVCETLAHYHLSSTAAEFLKAAPMKLAVLGMIELCRDVGVERLNLGSGLGGQADSLFEFKAGFSAGRAPFESARVVLDAYRYRALSAGSTDPAFFPAYRKGY